jgi:hypothetical protein
LAPARFSPENAPNEDPTQICTCQVFHRKHTKRRPTIQFAPARFSPENTPNEDPTQICTCQVSHRKHPKRRPYTNLHLPRFPLKTRQTKTLHKFAPARFSQENTPNENPTQICTSTQNTPNFGSFIRRRSALTLLLTNEVLLLESAFNCFFNKK